jgi:hypothetical protein
VPEGWRIDCRAAHCAAELAIQFEWEGSTLDWDALGWDPRDWDPYGPADIMIDRAKFDCFEFSEGEAPKTCVFEGDFDGDREIDRLTWVLHESTLRFDMLVRWGGSGTSSIVGVGSWSHYNPVRGRSGCAESSFQFAEWASQVRDPGDAAVRRLVTAEGGVSQDALALDTLRPQWIWFDGGYWRAALPTHDDELPPAFMAVGHTWRGGDPPSTSALACKEARRIRKTAHRKRSVERFLWTKAKDVARDPCAYTIDLDGDGATERVSWVVHAGVTGLRIDWPDGSVSVLGGGRAVPIDVLEGEPGCNTNRGSFDEIWNVAVAHWTGSAWELPGGGTLVPFDPNRVDGDALALTTMSGHVDLVFFVDGEFRLSAVPFAWHEIPVLMPYHDEWMRRLPPVPEVRRYLRPDALLRRRVQEEGAAGAPPRMRGAFLGT